MKSLLKPFAILALIYCLLGPVLLFLEVQVSGSEALQQAFPIAVVSVFFFVYSTLSLSVFWQMKTKRKGLMTSYYLATKLIRLMLTMFLIIAYALLVRENLLLFAIGVFVYYIVTMLYTGYYCIREEQHLNKANA